MIAASASPTPARLATDERQARQPQRRGRLARAVNDLTELLDATRRNVEQTRQRVAGTTPHGATRRVSLRDGKIAHTNAQRLLRL